MGTTVPYGVGVATGLDGSYGCPVCAPEKIGAAEVRPAEEIRTAEG